RLHASRQAHALTASDRPTICRNAGSNEVIRSNAIEALWDNVFISNTFRQCPSVLHQWVSFDMNSCAYEGKRASILAVQGLSYRAYFAACTRSNFPIRLPPPARQRAPSAIR